MTTDETDERERERERERELDLCLLQVYKRCLQSVCPFDFWISTKFVLVHVL